MSPSRPPSPPPSPGKPARAGGRLTGPRGKRTRETAQPAAQGPRPVIRAGGLVDEEALRQAVHGAPGDAAAVAPFLAPDAESAVEPAGGGADDDAPNRVVFT